MKAYLIKFFVILLLASSLASISFAQRQTGVIAGRIIDKDENPLPGATVTISGPALMGINSYVTSNTGFFRFPSLFPGEYELRAEMPGFKTTVRKGLIVSVGKTTELIIELEVAAVEEEVSVTAASPVVDVEASKVSVNYSPLKPARQIPPTSTSFPRAAATNFRVERPFITSRRISRAT